MTKILSTDSMEQLHGSLQFSSSELNTDLSLCAAGSLRELASGAIKIQNAPCEHQVRRD